MKFLRCLVLFILLAIGYSLSTRVAHAQSEFSVDANVNYNVQNSGKTLVTHNITLENNVSDLYATAYSLSLENITAQNIKVYDNKGTQYNFDIQKSGSTITIKITFPDSVVGRGQKRDFIISYENNSFAVKTGEIWEVTIPRLGVNTDFRSYQIFLKIPASFGLEAYISPSPKKSQKSDGGNLYTFDRNDIASTGITAGYGQFQVFSFNLSYHLENPLNQNTETTIAIPPDTAFQKVYVQKIEPAPVNVTVDADGNWNAIYDLSPKQRVDVTISGSVQIFASNRSYLKPTQKSLEDNLKETEYWQTTDRTIKALAADLKTPKAIYNYVAKTLKYDFSRVKPDSKRLGAVGVLKNPTQAICMEFTDLFIAIARAAGIPAREIDGYAYTENPNLQPLSLVADVLHAWPEYYDNDRGTWIPIDPTWASTSGGVDYFNKLDLRHFAFVIHGESSTTPYPPGSYKLGPNPQKDVYVSFGKLPDERTSTPTVLITPLRTLPFMNSIYTVMIKNPGPQALYSVNPIIMFDGKEKSLNYIDVFPPYSNYQIFVNVPFSLLGKGTPNIVEVKVGNTFAKITTNKDQIVISSLLIISTSLIAIIIIILFLLKKITIRGIFATIAATARKIHDKFIKRPPKITNNL